MKPSLQLTPFKLLNGDSTTPGTPMFTPTTMMTLNEMFQKGSFSPVQTSGGTYFNLARPQKEMTDDVQVMHISVKEEEEQELHEFPEIVVKQEVVVSDVDVDVEGEGEDNSDEDYTPRTRTTRKRTAPLRWRSTSTSSSLSPRPTDLTAKPKRRGNLKNDYDGLPPVERQKLKERRERNKQAAARCRQKREDLAKSLSDQVKAGDAKRDALQREVDDLKKEKSRLERLLRDHEAVCGLVGSDDADLPKAKRSRPLTLDLSRATYSPLDDVIVETPSNGLSLDVFLSSGSGLTPFLCSDDLLAFASHPDNGSTRTILSQ